MRILVIGAGGVGTAVVAIAARRDFFEQMVVADYDPGRVEHAMAQVTGDARFTGARVDASDVDGMVALIREHRITTREGLSAMMKLGVKNVPTICIDGQVAFASIIPDQNILRARLRRRRGRTRPGEDLRF